MGDRLPTTYCPGQIRPMRQRGKFAKLVWTLECWASSGFQTVCLSSMTTFAVSPGGLAGKKKREGFPKSHLIRLSPPRPLSLWVYGRGAPPPSLPPSLCFPKKLLLALCVGGSQGKNSPLGSTAPFYFWTVQHNLHTNCWKQTKADIPYNTVFAQVLVFFTTDWTQCFACLAVR